MSSLLICLNLGFLVFWLFLFFFNTIAAINTNIYINLCSFLTKFGLYLDVFEMFHADLQILPLAILGASDTEAQPNNKWLYSSWFETTESIRDCDTEPYRPEHLQRSFQGHFW